MAGDAVLYECVRVLMSLEVSSSHILEATNILGSFLQNNDPDIRFVSLSLLLEMTSINEDAVLRQRTTILSCLRESDPSIRRRALELIIALVQLNNVEDLVRELLQFLVALEGRRDVGRDDGRRALGRGQQDRVAGAAVRAVVHVAGRHAADGAASQRRSRPRRGAIDAGGGGQSRVGRSRVLYRKRIDHLPRRRTVFWRDWRSLP